MGFVKAAAFGPPAVAALQQAILAVKSADQLAPVTVVVPSNYAGLSLRRALSEPGSSGLVNVRFLVLARVAELLGAPLLAAQQRRPLTPWLRREAIRRALLGSTGTFEAIREHPATISALDTTFRDLRDAPDDTLEALAESGPRARDVVAVFRAFRELTSGRFYDQSDLSLAAAQAIRNGIRALSDVGQVIVYLPRSLSLPEAELVRALQAAGHLRIIVGVSGDAQVDALAGEMVARAGGSLQGGGEVASPNAEEIVRVNDPEEEVRQIVRMALRAASEGARLDRMAILYPARERYALLIHEQCRAAGIPHNGPAVGNLTQTLAGRTLLAMLQLRGTNFRRDAVMDWLTSAPIVQPREGERGRRVEAQRWDKISRDAGIVGGMAEWNQRLERKARELENKIATEREKHGGAEASASARSAERELRATQELQGFMRQLQRDLQPPPAGATLGAFAVWARALLERYLPAISTWTAEEADPYEEIASILEEIAEAEKLLPTETAAAADTERQFRQALTAMLEARGPAVGQFGQGIFFGPLSSAPGLDFDLVFVPGMTEGQAPTAGLDDPLLPDSERMRDGVAGHVWPREFRRLDERRNFLAAISAPRAVLLFPRADLRNQSKNLPSRWLLELSSSLAGQQLGSAEFEQLAAAPWLTSLPSFEAGLLSEPEAASAQERMAASLLRAGDRIGDHFLFAEGGRLQSGLESAGRRQPRFRRRGGHGTNELTRWDGGIGQRPELVPSAEHPASPTRMETLATCPFKYFMEHVLDVPETTRPEDALSITAADRGTLVHDCLEQFLREAEPRTTPDQPWSAEERERLLEIGREKCEEAEKRGATGKRIPWRADRARILRDLSLFLDEDERLRRHTGLLFAAAELAFGRVDSGPPAVKVELSNGATLAFRGQIDRIDRAADGRMAVYDYKGGRSKPFEEIERSQEDRTCGARHLQLPIYALAARQAMGAEGPVRADYWFVSEREQFKRIGYEVTEDEVKRMAQHLGVLTEMIGAGLFPARPGKLDNRKYENCRFCQYDQVCPGGDRAAAWRERGRAPGLEDYVEMSGDGGSEGDGEDRDD